MVDVIGPGRYCQDVIIPVGYGQVSWFFSGSGVPTGAACTLGFKNDQMANATAIASQLEAMFETNVLPQLVQNVGLEETLVKLGPNSTGPAASAFGSTAGALTGAQAPPQVTFLVQKVTNLGGRQGKGRMYLPGVAEAVVLQNGTIDTDFLALVRGAMEGLHDDMVAAELPPYLLHNDALAPTAITELDVSGTVATQRRRLRR